MKGERISLTEFNVIIPETRVRLWIFFSLIKFAGVSFVKQNQCHVSLGAFHSGGFVFYPQCIILVLRSATICIFLTC